MKKILLTALLAVSFTNYAQTAIFEDFESLTFPPPGWLVNNVSGANVTWRSSDPNVPGENAVLGYHAALLNGESIESGAEDWLISPPIVMPDNPHIAFYSQMQQAGDQGGVYKVMIGTDPQDLSSFTLLKQWTELEINPQQGVYANAEVALPATLEGETRYIAFVGMGNNADRWSIDVFTVKALCEKPISAFINDITDTSATILWESFSNLHEIEILEAEQTPTGVGIPVTTNGTFVVAGLIPNTIYKCYIRSICGNSLVSTWAGPYYFTTAGGKLSGFVTFDANGDAFCDNSDILGGLEVQITVNDEEPVSVYTNAQGEYVFYGLGTGTNSVSVLAHSPVGFSGITPVEQDITFNDEMTTAEINICLPQPEEVTDLSVVLVPENVARPGVAARYNLVVRNEGNTFIENAEVVVNFNSTRLDFEVSDFTSATVAGDNITISLSALAAYSSQSGYLQFTVKQPPVNIGGEALYFIADLTTPETDDNLENNSYSFAQIIVNSYDPNDVTVLEGPEIYLDQAGDYLTYVVRFQNTGSAEALRIRIKNTLDGLLDWDTFQPISSSHAYSLTRKNNELDFLFEDINLTYQSDSEEESQGFVSYRIKPTAAFGLGDIASNTADIYFDFNPAVTTNTATTEVVAVIGLATHEQPLATLYPNPVSDQLKVEVNQGVLQSVTVHDVNGRLCLSANANTIDTSALNGGIYFVKVTTDAGSTTYKIIKH